jgi:hypothetical protein
MFEVRISKRSGHFLVSRCDDLMEFKLESANEVMSSQVVDLLVIIHIIYFTFELLLLLEVVLTGNGLDPLRVEVIVDGLGLA